MPAAGTLSREPLRSRELTLAWFVNVCLAFVFYALMTAMALAQSIIPVSRRAEGTGYFTLSMTLATAIGPFLALMLAHRRSTVSDPLTAP